MKVLILQFYSIGCSQNTRMTDLPEGEKKSFLKMTVDTIVSTQLAESVEPTDG